MKKVIVTTGRAPAPITPSVSQCVTVGDWIYMCGQLPLDPKTGAIVGTTIEEQAKCCIEYVKAIVEAAGGTLADIVKVTVLLTDMANFKRFNAVYEKYFVPPAPARDCFAVGLVGDGKILVELAAIACKGSGKA